MGAINVIATILNMRAPGMTLMKMPLFVWTWLITAFLLIAVMPVLAALRHHDADGHPLRHQFLQMLLVVATRCCSSMCSGSSGIPRCTS